jgi:hypothetical protein
VHGLFTQPTESAYGGAISANKAFLLTVSRSKHHFEVVGRVMAKCLVDGIRMPINLNSTCLDYIIGPTTQPSGLYVCLALLQETNAEDSTLYRNVLRERQDTILYVCFIGAFDGSRPEQNVTDENKASIVCNAIWSRAVHTCSSSPNGLRNGLA